MTFIEWQDYFIHHHLSSAGFHDRDQQKYPGSITVSIHNSFTLLYSHVWTVARLNSA